MRIGDPALEHFCNQSVKPRRLPLEMCTLSLLVTFLVSLGVLVGTGVLVSAGVVAGIGILVSVDGVAGIRVLVSIDAVAGT